MPWRSLHHVMHSGASSLLLPRVCTIFHSSESHPLPKPQSLSPKCCLKKAWETPYFLLPSGWSREVFLLCKPNATLSQPLFLCLPFVSPWKGFSPLCGTEVFLSSNSLPCTSQLPWCLPPSMELFLPVHRSISLVFQVIWLQYNCLWETGKAQGPPTSLLS